MPAVGEALAELAEAALEAALAIAREEYGDGHEACRLAIIGMGKTGGGELNYVSDVDVIFVAEPADGTDEETALRVGTALATGTMRACSTPTSEGSLWPVDAALRPEGKQGPLVRTISSHKAYYERWAKTWEFQALLKAWVSAGDKEIGAALQGRDLADGLGGRRPRQVRRGRPGHASPRRAARAGQRGGAPAQAGTGRSARRRVQRAAAPARARAQRPQPAVRDDARGPDRARAGRLRRARGRRRPRPGLPAPALPRAPHPAAPAAPHAPHAGDRARTPPPRPRHGAPDASRTRRRSPTARRRRARCAGCTSASSTGRCSRRLPG